MIGCPMRATMKFLIRICSLLLVLVGADRTPLCAAPFQHSYAVVVGISNYSSPHWPHLPYARGDAAAMADTLKAQGYEVTELYDTNATKHNILAAFDTLANKLKVDDRVVVFISSHGANRHVGGQIFGYIVPYDGSDFASYISDAELKNASQLMQNARHQIFIMDVCYAGLMITRSGGVSPDIPNYIDEITNRVAREIVSAGG